MPGTIALAHPDRKMDRSLFVAPPRHLPVARELSTQAWTGTPRRRAHQTAAHDAGTSQPPTMIAVGSIASRAAETPVDTREATGEAPRILVSKRTSSHGILHDRDGGGSAWASRTVRPPPRASERQLNSDTRYGASVF
jgi:hypothetical protein